MGGIHFAGEALAGGYSRSLVRNQKNGWNLEANLGRSNDSFKQIRLHACVFRQYSIIFITHPMVTIRIIFAVIVLMIFFTFYLRLLTDSGMFKHSFYILSYLVMSVIIHDMNSPNPFIEDRAHLALRLAAEKLSAMKKQNTPQPSCFFG